MQMPGRTFSSGSYRYGFNGKENDNEVKGKGNQQDYGARIYDPRIGKWFSLDPLQKKYPNESPYHFVSNNPILYKDQDGRDKVWYVKVIAKDGTFLNYAIKREINNKVNLHPLVEVYGSFSSYSTDVKQTVTINLKTGKISTSSEESDYSSRRGFWEGVGMKLKDEDDDGSRGKQGGGWTFTSESGLNVDGAKTDAEYGSSNMINIDVLGALNAYTKSVEVANIKNVEDLPDISNLAKDLTTTIKEQIDGNTKKEPEPSKVIALPKPGTKNAAGDSIICGSCNNSMVPVKEVKAGLHKIHPEKEQKQ